MRRLAFVLLLVGLGLVAPAGPASGTEADRPVPDPAGLVREQLAELDSREVDRFLDELQRQVGEYVPVLSIRDAVELVLGRRPGYRPADLLVGLLRYLFREVVANSRLLVGLVLLAIICAVLQSLQAAFEGETAARLAHAVSYLVLVTLALSGFTIAATAGRQVVDDLVSFMLALLPLLVTVLAASGAVTSAGIFHPLLIVVVHGVSVLVRDVILPLVFFAAVIELVSSLSARVRVSGLADLLKQVSVVLMGLAFAVFLGVVVVQGAAGAVADGVGLRTAKYVAHLIPVVGAMFSDAVELVIGTSLLLKNALGVVGLVGVFLVAAFPLVKLLSVVFVFRLAAALVQPLMGVGESMVVDALNGMAGLVLLVFAACTAVALMFFVAVAAMVGAGNVAAMLR